MTAHGNPLPADARGTPSRESHVVLSDGRKLGHAEYGDLDGTPLLWFPGLPGEGHFLCADRFEEILRAITRHAQRGMD
jgi:hypothetical protein